MRDRRRRRIRIIRNSCSVWRPPWNLFRDLNFPISRDFQENPSTIFSCLTEMGVLSGCAGTTSDKVAPKARGGVLWMKSAVRL